MACSNRLEAINPALVRVAPSGAQVPVRPPGGAQRAGAELSPDQLLQLAEAPDRGTTAPRRDILDFTQRLVPAAVLHAFPDRRLAFGQVLEMRGLGRRPRCAQTDWTRSLTPGLIRGGPFLNFYELRDNV